MQRSEKIQKVLARQGIASRRTIEKWIVQGRIKVNDHLANIGDRVSEQDHIYVDDQLIELTPAMPTQILLYHKPAGLVCTYADPEGRDTVFSALPPLTTGRWISIGRLDINTTGLLMFTNNGELANTLMHPQAQLEREYQVRILGDVTANTVHRLTKGVKLEDGLARFEDIVDGGGKGANHWFYVVVVEGRNRLVRRLWESQGLTVSRLKRVRYGPIFLPKSLAPGAWMQLDAKLVSELLEKYQNQSC